MTDRPPPGRSLATRRAIADVVRSAVLTSYGVTRLEGRGFAGRLLARLGLVRPGIWIRLDRGLEIDLFVSVGSGLPIAEVARQIDSGARYAVRRTFGVEVRRLTVHVGGLRYQPASVPPTRESPPGGSPGTAAPRGTSRPPSGGPASDTDGSDADSPYAVGGEGERPSPAEAAGAPAAREGKRRRAHRSAEGTD